MSPKKQRETGEPGLDVQEKPKSKPKLEQPKRYKVLLHDDDFTPGMFVVQVLVYVFNKSEGDAMAIMRHAESHGSAVAGVYTFEVAETKVAETMKMATEAQVPLLCTLEPE
jgi:ATP-dependent Clp protease adaptor protein ClpS